MRPSSTISPHDDATDDTAPGQDAGVGPASLAFTSFLLALLCLSPFYMLGSNLWDLINGRGEHRAAQRDRGARVSHVVCRLDELLAARGMTLVELSEKVGVTTVNLSVLKNDRAKAHPLLHALRHLRGPELLSRRAAGGRPGLIAP